MMYMSGAYDFLFLPEFVSNRLQTLALLSLVIEVYCYNFKNSQLFFRIYSGFYGSLCMDQCRINDVHVGWSLVHLNQQRVKSLCLLSTLNVRPFDKQWSLSIHKYKRSLRKCLTVQMLAQMYASAKVRKWRSVQIHAHVLECARAQVLAQMRKCSVLAEICKCASE